MKDMLGDIPDLGYVYAPHAATDGKIEIPALSLLTLRLSAEH